MLMSLMQTRHPCSRNYVHCIFVLLFVGSPISIDRISTTTPLPCQNDLAKGKNITKDPRYGKSEVYPAVWLKCKFALAQAQGESKDPSHTSGSITCPLCPTLFFCTVPNSSRKAIQGMSGVAPGREDSDAKEPTHVPETMRSAFSSTCLLDPL